MSTVKSYPHYEINVKDNSIYNFAIDETLPVHRAVWVLPTEKGPVGQPVWVASKAQFDRIFGAQTLAQNAPRFRSPTSQWLRKLMAMNGQFIVRALPENSERAAVVIWARVAEKVNGMVQFAKSDDGACKTVQEDLTERFTGETPDADFEGVNFGTTADYGKYAVEPESVEMVQIDRYFDEFNQYLGYARTADDTTTYVDADGGALSAAPEGVFRVETKYFNKVTPKTEDCIEITFITRAASDDVLSAIDDQTFDETTLKPIEGADFIEYPILVVAANYKGLYGNDYAFRFFSSRNDNNSENIAWFKTVMNSFGAYRRDFNSTTTTPITDLYDRSTVTFAADPNCVDRETSVAKDMESILESSYDSNSEETEEFPFVIYSFESNLEKIGERIIEIENKDIDVLGISSMNFATYDDFAAEFGADKVGYAIDVLGGLNPDGNPYPHVKYANGDGFITSAFWIVTNEDVSSKIATMDYLVSAPEETITNVGIVGDIVKLDKNTDIYLVGGTDGTGIWNTDGSVNNAFVDQSMYNFVTLKMNKTIVDKFRYPFTHLYDIGYSMTTKFAMLDFLDIRDDVGVELSSQVLLSNEWMYGIKKPISLNDMYEDIMNGIVLRERAMMMRESVLHGTETMRATVFTQVGRLVDGNSDPVPFTFWSAYQHAQYGNRPNMSIQEPRGLPYSYNQLFKDWKWVPHYESQKERTWNTGMNYCQYADMSRIFYPALRTVYRHDTSILSDQWDVDALIYTKHECRKAWAHFVGRNDRVAELQAGIKKYLEEKLAYLYSGKFDFEVEVYQTEEEKKIGYIQHVKLKLTFPATLRVLIFDIEVNREGYTPEA